MNLKAIKVIIKIYYDGTVLYIDVACNWIKNCYYCRQQSNDAIRKEGATHLSAGAQSTRVLQITMKLDYLHAERERRLVAVVPSFVFPSSFFCV